MYCIIWNYCDFSNGLELNVSKDLVLHAKLIHRLQNYCTDGPLLSWVIKFLSNRSHCARVGNIDSAAAALISRVVVWLSLIHI